MLVSYIENSRMYHRCLVWTFQFLHQWFQIVKKRKNENWKSCTCIGYFGRSILTASHNNFKMLLFFCVCLSINDIVLYLVSVERHEQTKRADGSSLHGATEAHTTAVLQPGSEWSRETEPVWTVLTRGKNQALRNRTSTNCSHKGK